MTVRLTPEQKADREMREVPTLTDLVVGEALNQHWKLKRDRQGKPGWNLGSGWPDLFLCRGLEAIAIELKNETAPLAEEQVAWMAALELAGIKFYVFRPSDWREGRIQELLK